MSSGRLKKHTFSCGNRFFSAVILSFSLMLLWGSSALKSQPPGSLTFVRKFTGADSHGGRFQNASAMDLDTEGSVYIVDRGRNRLLKFDPKGVFIREIGGFGQGSEQFDDIRDVDASSTLDIYLADFNNDRIVRLNQRLEFLNSYKTNPDAENGFEQPLSIAVSPQNDLFILENVDKRILKLNRFTEVVQIFGGLTATLGQLLEPVQIALDENLRIFVSDPGQRAVLVYDYLGNFVQSLLHPQMVRPAGIAVGADGNLYVTEKKNKMVLIFNPKLKFRTLLKMPAALPGIQDVALSYDKRTGRRTLYVLAPTECWIFNLKLEQ